MNSIYFFFVLIFGVRGMPYQVPMQGKVGGSRTLVLLDNMLDKHTYSIFFGILTGALHEPTILSFIFPI